MRASQLAAALAVAALISAPAASYATTATANMGVSLTVTASCTIATTNMAFPTTSLLSTALTQTATVTAQCTNTTPYTIALGDGAGTGATAASRKLTAGSNTIAYSLYSDSGYTTVWGTGSTDGSTVAGTGNGSSQALTVYGQVPALTAAPAPGSYSDTVAVTITY